MATVDKELAEFVQDALARGLSKPDIARVLDEAGWPADRAASAIDAYADIAFAVPVPRPRRYVSARDAFLYLILFGTLGFAAFYLGNLIFNIVDLTIPGPGLDTWRTVEGIKSEIRFAIAAVIVTFPLYLFMAYRIESAIRTDPEQRASLVRKWLTYVALVIAALFIIGDLITLLYKFLDGGLTLRIGLKVVTVAVLAGPIFGYYLSIMTRDERKG